MSFMSSLIGHACGGMLGGEDTLVTMISTSTVQAVREFVRERNWEQFHSPANLAKSISIEAAELLECYQWSDRPRGGDTGHVRDELADVLIYCLMMADRLGCDPDGIIRTKLEKNQAKYPAAKSKGSSAKYRELQ